ncbi:MAG TPA: TetR/AcrR family transcriptional regulator, partial [Actinomycetota bacterium]|nr:TetR/AcrR family transcriptional regulator [Actinomycetota bacterium]
YESAVAEARSLAEMVSVAREIHREDLDSGHITVLSEMIAGSINDPELGPQVTARMQPWIDFAERAIERALAGAPLAGLLPVRDLAFAVVAFYIGIDLLTALDGDRTRAESLFTMAESFLPLIQSDV